MTSAIRDNSARARQAVISFSLLLFSLLISCGLAVWQYILLDESINGISDTETLELSDSIVSMATYVYLGLYLVSTILFIGWFRRAYFNLHLVNPDYPTMSEGWAAGAWFVPFINFVRPLVIMRELWLGVQERVRPETGWQYPSAVLNGWWALWIISSVTNQVASRMYKGAEDAPSYQTALCTTIISNLLSATALILLIYIIRSYHKIEQELQEQSTADDNGIFSFALPDVYGPATDSSENK